MKHHDEDVFEGRDLDEAIHAAADGLGIPEGELHYEVLEQGRKGLLGLGTKNVRIRVMRPVEHLTDHEILSGAEPRKAQRPVVPPPVEVEPDKGEAPPAKTEAKTAKTEAKTEAKRSSKPRRRRSGRSRKPRSSEDQAEAAAAEGEGEAEEAAPAEPVEPLTGQALEVQQTLERILEMSGLELETRPTAASLGVALRLTGADRKLLKQRNAELLLALQFLLNRMARRAWPEVGRIRLTTDGDTRQRESQLIRLTRGAAKQVAKTGRTKKLRPMNAYERRLVHLTIREYAGLTSSSDGSGSMKRVRISKVQNTLSV